MGSRIKRKNIIFGLLLLTGLLGSAFELYQICRIDRVNDALRQGKLITDDHYPYQQKFSAAYQHGVEKEYKHAIQTYSQLLETALPLKEQARIQFNIGNNLFLSGLSRLSGDGKMKDDIKYSLSQAKVAYEQTLRLEPSAPLAKFNLSLLLSILPQSMASAPKEQSGMELSNLPIGLP
jgi:mxaK protein